MASEDWAQTSALTTEPSHWPRLLYFCRKLETVHTCCVGSPSPKSRTLQDKIGLVEQSLIGFLVSFPGISKEHGFVTLGRFVNLYYLRSFLYLSHIFKYYYLFLCVCLRLEQWFLTFLMLWPFIQSLMLLWPPAIKLILLPLHNHTTVMNGRVSTHRLRTTGLDPFPGASDVGAGNWTPVFYKNNTYS